ASRQLTAEPARDRSVSRDVRGSATAPRAVPPAVRGGAPGTFGRSPGRPSAGSPGAPPPACLARGASRGTRRATASTLVERDPRIHRGTRLEQRLQIAEHPAPAPAGASLLD